MLEYPGGGEKQAPKEPETEQELSYEELFAVFSGRIERLLVRGALVLAGLLLSVQLLLLVPGVRHLLVKVERMEGDPFSSKIESTK